MRDERFQARLPAASTEADRTRVAAELSHAGVARLDDAERLGLFEVRRAMANESPELCAGLWTGSLPPELLGAGLRGLDEKQQLVWIELSARAVAVELAAASPPPHVKAAARDAAFGELLARMPPAEREAFQRVVLGADRTPEGACRAFKAAGDAMGLVSPGARNVILRAGSNAELVDP